MKGVLMKPGLTYRDWAFCLVLWVGSLLSLFPLQVEGQSASVDWSDTQLLFDATEGWGEHLSLTADLFGGAHLVWEHNPTASSSTSQNYQPAETLIYYSSWDGIEWSSPVDVMFGNLSYPRIAADPDGRLHMAFSDGQCVRHAWAWIPEAHTAQGWSLSQCLGPRSLNHALAVDSDGILRVLLAQSEQLLYVQSNDGGANWSDPTRVAEAPLSATYTPEIAVDNHGRVHAVWAQAQLPDGIPFTGVYYSNSDDGGDSWSQSIVLATGNYRDPVIAVAQEAVYVAWNSGVGESRRFLARSEDGGQNWTPPVAIVEAFGGWLWHPGIAIDSANSIHIVTAQGTGALYVLVEPGGRVSLPRQLYDPNQQTAAPNLVVTHGNRLLTVFRGPQSSLYFAHATSSAATATPLPLPPFEAKTTLTASPSPTLTHASPAATREPVSPPVLLEANRSDTPSQAQALVWAVLPVILMVAGVILLNRRKHR